ncbi:MAG: XdhC family protein [Vicinamibacterales bacterium]
MSELDAVLGAWRGLRERGEDAVLATVVHVTGSAYRRPGARMLVLRDGRRVGTISGGCLEGDLARKCWWLTESGQPLVRIYDTSDDDDGSWEFGLGCNGQVHVLLERIRTPEAESALAFLDGRLRSRTPAAVATVIATGRSGRAVGDRLLVDAAGVCGGSLATSALEAVVAGHAARSLADSRSCLARIDDCEAFVEVLAVPPDVVVFGAGDDAVPLVSMARTLGWRVTVADGRPAYATTDRFPGATRLVLLRRGEVPADLDIDQSSVVVMMTHNYPLDRRLLPPLLDRRPRYLGLLGPRARSERLFREIGVPVPSWVHAPIGHDIGGDDPAGVALSIAAEVQAVIAGRRGGELRGRLEPIHAAVREAGTTPVGSTRGERPRFCEVIGASRAS